MKFVVQPGSGTEFYATKGQTVVCEPNAYGQTLVRFDENKEVLAWGKNIVSEDEKKFFAFNASIYDMDIYIN